MGEDGFAVGWEAEAQRLRNMMHFDEEGFAVDSASGRLDVDIVGVGRAPRR